MDKKTLGVFAVVFAIAITTVLMAAFRPTGFVIGTDDYVVKIGYKPNANYIPLFVALENGYFENEGLKVETVRFDSTNAIMDAFVAGSLDATPTGNVIVSYSAEITQPDLFKLYNFDFYTDTRHSENMVARKGSGIATYKDLEGKTIGVNKGVFSRVMTTKFLEQRNVSGFKIIELDDKLLVQALEVGQIDALVSLEPNPAIAVDKGIAEYVEGGSVYRKTVGFNSAFSAGIISTSLLKNHPTQARKFLSAMKKSIEFIEKHFEESKRILPKYMPIEPRIAEKTTFAEIYFIDALSEEQKELIQKTADFLSDEGIIRGKVDTASLLLSSEYLK